MEDSLRGHPLVSQCVVVGDQRPFVAALITLDEEMLPGWLSARDLPEMTPAQAAEHPVVLEALERAVKRTNKKVSRAESIRRFELLETDFTVENNRSEEHTSELQSRGHLVCRLLLEKS